MIQPATKLEVSLQVCEKLLKYICFFYLFQDKFTSLNSFLWSMLSFGLWAGSCNVRFAASMPEFNSHVE